MRHDNTEDQSARTASSRFSKSEFGTTLPPDVRAELLRPKRSRTFGRSVKASQAYRKLTLAALVFGAVLAGAIAFWTEQRPPVPLAEAPASPAPVMQPTPAAVQPTPTPAMAHPTPTPAVDWHDGVAAGRAGTIPTVRRAELVQLPAPKAELISIPVGGSLWLTMPYGDRVWATYCGKVPNFASLPSVGRFLGETWMAADSNIPWIWTCPPGGVAQWVDP